MGIHKINYFNIAHKVNERITKEQFTNNNLFIEVIIFTLTISNISEVLPYFFEQLFCVHTN